MTVISETRSAN